MRPAQHAEQHDHSDTHDTQFHGITLHCSILHRLLREILPQTRRNGLAVQSVTEPSNASHALWLAVASLLSPWYGLIVTIFRLKPCWRK